MSGVAMQTPASTATDYAALQFVFQQLLSKVYTIIVARVQAVTNDGALAPAGTVDVLPLVNQITSEGVAVPHNTVFKLPYVRVQGGANAVIMDPQVGDIGLVAIAMRDISVVKRTKAQGQPGSRRMFSPADGLYIGGVLNGAPTQYVQFTDDGVKVVSPTKVTIQAPAIELDGPVTATSTIAASEDVTADGISLHDHLHGEVSTGSDQTGPPE